MDCSILQESITVQLENVHKDTSQQQNVDWLRKQHMIRQQMSSSPSPPHSSTSSSPEFQVRTVQGWQVLHRTVHARVYTCVCGCVHTVHAGTLHN